MKKLLPLLIVTLACSLVPFAIAAADTEAAAADTEAPVEAVDAAVAAATEETELASRLKELGMFIGVGENSDGTTDFDLDRAPTRAEALVMLIRALGKEGMAMAHPKTHPFTDVPNWADGYVSYAYSDGLTNGVSDTLFGAGEPVSAEMYLTFVLRALGYADGDGNDFSWDSPWALAAWCGIYPPQAANTSFGRGDVVNVTCSALFASIKGTGMALYERLVHEAVFTEGQFQKAFPVDPFSDFRELDMQISSYIYEHGDFVAIQNDKNSYPLEAHVILGALRVLDIPDTTEPDGLLKVPVFVGTCVVGIAEGDIIQSFERQTELWLFELQGKPLQIRTCIKASSISNEGRPLEEHFSSEILGMQPLLSQGLYRVSELEAQERISSGALRYEPPTYEESLAQLSADSSFQVTQSIESEQCTILLRVSGGTPHSGNVEISLVYKPGSAVGGGTVVSLPLPKTSGLGMIDRAPDELRLSEDGLTLHYSYHFGLALTVDGHTYHEAMTYSYATDLVAGETTLAIGSPDAAA